MHNLGFKIVRGRGECKSCMSHVHNCHCALLIQMLKDPDSSIRQIWYLDGATATGSLSHPDHGGIGRLQSLDWTSGLDWWTGLVDWTGGLTLKIIFYAF